MTDLNDTLFFLASALTGKTDREVFASIHERSVNSLVDGQEFYLPDGGYSRIVVSAFSGKAFLTDNSREAVKEAWGRCRELISDLEEQVRQARGDEPTVG
jgi:hypothetical protein